MKFVALMEFFFDFLCTIAASIFLSFLISKLLSLDSSSGDRAAEFASDSTLFEYDFVNKTSTSCDTEIQKRISVDDDSDTDFDDDTVRFLQNSGDDEVAGGGVVEAVVVGGVEKTVIHDKLLDGSDDQMKFCEIPVEVVNHEALLAKDAKSEEARVLKSGDDNERDGRLYEIVMDDDDDWEGIERTELEKQFGAAVRCTKNILDLGSDVQMQLHGLHKVATEGPCHEPQPMAFKVSARAKWHAWHRLGNLSQEAAMEQYIKLLTLNIPGWLGEELTGDSPHSFSDVGATSKPTSV